MLKTRKSLAGSFERKLKARPCGRDATSVNAIESRFFVSSISHRRATMETYVVLFSVLVLIAALADRSGPVNPPVMLVPVTPQTNSNGNSAVAILLLLVMVIVIASMVSQG
jgi:hypothetical protein